MQKEEPCILTDVTHVDSSYTLFHDQMVGIYLRSLDFFLHIYIRFIHASSLFIYTCNPNDPCFD